MSLIILIFLSIFIACVKSSEKAKIKSNEKKWRFENENRQNKEKRFIERMIDDDFETQCRDECIYAKSDRYIAKRDEMQDILGYTPSQAEVWVGLMAKKGKLPHKFVKYGFANMIVGDWYPSDQAYDMWEKHFLFILWVDDQLEKAGVKERIGICCQAERGTEWLYFSINECLNDKKFYRDIYRRHFAFSFKPIRNGGHGKPLTLDTY